MIVLTPWKKPLNRGTSRLNASSMSLILMVSCGVVTTIASMVPAIRPAMKEVAPPNMGLPVDESTSALLACSKAEKRIAAFGVAKYTMDERPR